MKKGLFTVTFMVLTSIVFISALAFINEYSKERIIQNLKIERYKSMLYAFNIFPAGVKETDLALISTTADIRWKNKQILETIENQIKKSRLPISEKLQPLLTQSFLAWKDSVDLFVRVDENQKAIAYGFSLKGKGLWGTIEAFGVISTDLRKMIGIDFTQQVETPGLGARITETEFKYFFRQLDLRGFHALAADQAAIIMIREKSQSNIENSANSLQAITGATQTCQGILNMLNIDLKFYISIIKENQKLLQARGFIS